jgi:hypothetical protein
MLAGVLAAVAMAAATVLVLTHGPAIIGGDRTPAVSDRTGTRAPTEATGTTAAAAEDPSTPATTRSSPGESSPVRTQAANLKIPAAFEGAWSGHTTSTNPIDADGAENTVDLEAGESTASWSERNAGGECTATITLTKVEKSQLTFSLGANEGGCVAGTVWLALRGNGTLTYTWRDVPGPGLVTQTGALRKN